MKKTEIRSVTAIDETDLQILSVLRTEARTPVKHIAEKTYLSPTAVAARIEKLENEGYIEGYALRVSVLRLCCL